MTKRMGYSLIQTFKLFSYFYPMKKAIILSAITIFLFTACEKKAEQKVYSTEEIKMESKKANDFFDKAFDEYVDRQPLYHGYLGIKKDQDKWNDGSDEHEA